MRKNFYYELRFSWEKTFLGKFLNTERRTCLEDKFLYGENFSVGRKFGLEEFSWEIF
jgi:hypothetical protein